MCLPILMAAGGLFSAAGSVMAGQAQAAAYEAQAETAKQNARLAELAGIEELQKGAREEKNFREKARQFQASQRTAFAASGTQLSGSPLSVLADTAMGIEQDAATLRYNTLQNKWAQDVNAVNFRNQAAAAGAGAKNAKTAGWVGAFSSLLSTAGSIAGITPKNSTGSGVNGGTITVGGGTSGWSRSYERMKKGWGF